MQILQSGELAGVWPRQTRCPVCVAVLDVDTADIYPQLNGPPDYGALWKYTCAFCNTDMLDIPYRWVAELQALHPGVGDPPVEMIEPFYEGSGESPAV